MSGHKPWPLARKNRTKLAAAPAPAAVPAVELVWGPVSFLEAPEPLIEALIKTIDEDRLADADVEKMLDWAQANSRDQLTLTWAELP